MVSVCLGASAALGVADVFGIAFAACTLVFAGIDVAHGAGLVLYATQTRWFATSRATLYAALRATAVRAARAASVPERVARLAPLLLSLAETVGMRLVGCDESYAFAAGDFAVYAALKTSVVVLVPMLEDAARDAFTE